MIKIICLLYLLAGIVLHYGWLKTEKANSALNEASFWIKLIFTFYSIFVGPINIIKCAIQYFKERVK